MIQDIAPHVFDNEFKIKQPEADAPVIICLHNKVAVSTDGNGDIHFPTRAELEGEDMTFTYLFSIDDTEYFMGVWNTPSHEAPANYSYQHVRTFRTALPKDRAFAGITGYSLWLWYHTHRFCGHCGIRTERAENERKIVCPSCRQRFYPTINPAVIVGVINDGKLLMSKYAGRENKRFALIAGFAEAGESIEETVKREVMEEVGIKVKDLRFYKSQPWAFSNSLLMGFWARVDGDDTLNIDRNELSDAGWYSPDEIPEDEEKIAITQEMMTMFRKGSAPF